MQIVKMVLDDLGHGNQALLQDMGIGHRDVANVSRGKRVPLGRVLRINLVRGRGDLDLFTNLFLVIQEQGELVVSRVQRNSLACKHEETLFADFRLVVAGSKVVDDETSRCVGFRPIGMPGGVFELHLRGHNRHSVFVQNDAGAIRRVRRSGLPSSEDAENNQHPSEQPNKLHATPSLETPH